ncbi:putative dehydrogenase [Pseudonocardia hierapolitana]|uniref:Putative dehydrogenase n=1 Tax=Pseudonocardia hierapolitana TaxID=1128676 RepID=A0A561SVU9_9PSEU|nr:Gfo/Idh/MocA family oxidoreductase [Pseudonocardia hierapolitana]TWF78988.1 putative dehydrogenase [Pseudonocardia hierapolitana]
MRSGSIRIAVVGNGYWGSKHVRVLSSLPDVDVTVVDVVDERLAEAAAYYPAARFARSLEDVLDDIDAVVVATPPAEHCVLTALASEAGKPTLVEKPLTTSVEEAEILVESAERNGTVLMVGHTFEYNPAVWKLKEIIQAGSLGRILYINAQRLSLGRYQRDVNVVWDLAPHDLSIVSYLLDDIPSAAAVWADRNIGIRHADVAYLRLDFERAATHAFIHVSWLNPNKVRQVTVVGERKMAVYDDLSDNERIRVYDIGVDPRDVDEPGASHAMPVSYRTGDITSPYIQFQEPLLLQDRHFVECARTGTQPNTPGQRGLDIVRVLAASDVALATGRRVDIHHNRPSMSLLPIVGHADAREPHPA